MQYNTKNGIYETEFTFEAVERDDLMQMAFDFFSGLGMLRYIGVEEGKTEEEKTKTRIEQVNGMVKEYSKGAKLSIDFFFLGLLEHHGPCGDRTQDVLTRDDAKRIYKEFARENPEDARALHKGLLDSVREQMETDGFFDRIGLTEFMQKMNEAPIPQVKPQDHKKKANVKA